MGILIRKELLSILCSGIGLFFALIFLVASGSMLWFFEGNFNIMDTGYATLEKFFSLSSILFVLLIPALTMRLIAEEKRNRTLDMLRSRPISISAIIGSKWLASLLFVVLVLLPTFIYVYTLYVLGSPVGNLDLVVIMISYLSLIGLGGVFIAVGIFASSLSQNQIIAFVVALFINFVIYFGFDLLSALFDAGATRVFVASCGLSYHLSEVQRGVISMNNVLAFFNYIFIIYLTTLCVLSLKNKKTNKRLIVYGFGILVLNVVMLFLPNSRFDFTADKRYTISDYSKALVGSLAESESSQVKINVYLEGNLNFGFQRLRNATNQFLGDLNRYAGYKMEISFINPATLNVSREELPDYMAHREMPPIMLNEVDRDGKVSKQLIYPYAEVIVDGDTLQVSLLKNIKGNTAEENLTASIVNLEFQFVDALRLLMRNEPQAIAFIEGHGELPRAYVYDAEEALAKYFFVNRGEIGVDPSILDNFRVVIIAGPTKRYSEAEKYILDQYLMKGGRILWLIDGAYVSLEDLANKGQSASMRNETGLDDLLFTYGVRIESNFVQDAQSTQILVQNDSEAQPVTIPWYYSPLLLPSLDNIITKDITEVKAAFVSSVDVLNKSKSVSKNILLTTSQHSRIVPVPEMITFDVEHIQSDVHYFNESFLSVGVSLKGTFQSAFNNRLVPDSVSLQGYKTRLESADAKMIVVGSSDIIRNEVIGQGDNTEVLPMGYDRISGRRYGNKDFIVNAVNWLANDDGWMELRSKTQVLNLLDKKLIYEHRNKYAVLNILFPVCFIGLLIGGVILRRRYKYIR
ncbi:ABC-2 type transport system permease protein [Dysgonomonas alginatilytica]|uniref:ABC-2 type transport system permease protein n=1 Tax=Dysgonomonas alginatilytica TaxID=1605892 RepID=A0A2V3PRR1_9BACT|nr:gliding motility-associated ABC transporter substrate-binding protein GldG [Dysgonomonas alginatilytica]PXV65063.1 ABC-2 type transport system permease protein [Dysgonomonas alginatilytica]